VLAEWRGETMGTHAQVVVDAEHAALLDLIEPRLHDWNRRWSRFRPDSEISALNTGNGAVVVSPDTATLLALAVDAWRFTDGRFDPTVHDAVVAAGYDRPFRDGPGPASDPRPVPGVEGVSVDTESGLVSTPPGLRFDLGGIAKGHAADLLVAELLASGATGAAAAIGGDTAVGGQCPFARAWPIHVDGHAEPVAHLERGGFCLSTTARRRWRTEVGDAHHIIDPGTARPATTDAETAAVAASTAATAEVVATALIVEGPSAGAARLERMGLTGFVRSPTGFGAIVDPDQSLNPRNPLVSALRADGRRCE